MISQLRETHVGVNCFGPIEVKKGQAGLGLWSFTCKSSRVVDLVEVSHSLETNSYSTPVC